jgi:hypothetical protein
MNCEHVSAWAPLIGLDIDRSTIAAKSVITGFTEGKGSRKHSEPCNWARTATATFVISGILAGHGVEYAART